MRMKSLEKKSRRGWLKESFATAVVAAAVAFGAPAQANDTIKIGFSMALTGGLAGAGKGALIAMQVWAEDTNARAVFSASRVELVYYDESDQPRDRTRHLHQAAGHRQGRLRGVRIRHEPDRAAMPIVMQRGLVFPSLFGLAVNEKFNYSNYFQIMPSGPVR